MTYSEPSFFDEVEPPLGELSVETATKLYARTGEWPWWFLRELRVPSEDVPREYVVLALQHRWQLERELGVALPVVAPVTSAPPAPTPRMEQLELGGEDRAAAGAERGGA